MATTVFENDTGSGDGTLIVANWLNDVDLLTYEIFTTLSITDAVIAPSLTIDGLTIKDGAVQGGSTLGTEQTSTSGTSIDFTSIPSWAKEIKINFIGVSTNGTSIPIVQIGDAGGLETSAYLGSTGEVTGSSQAATNFTTGFGLAGTWSGATVIHGTMTLTLEDAANFTWVAAMLGGKSNTGLAVFGGASKSLSAALDRLTITTVGGSDTFDAGSINILYS